MKESIEGKITVHEHATCGHNDYQFVGAEYLADWIDDFLKDETYNEEKKNNQWHIFYHNKYKITIERIDDE